MQSRVATINPPILLPTRYRDSHGDEETTIANHGPELHILLRGVEFVGMEFDDFEPKLGSSATESLLSTFTLSHNLLCDCTFSFEVPVLVVSDDDQELTSLLAQLDIGKPRQNGSIEHVLLKLSLRVGGAVYESSAQDGWFDDALHALRQSMPGGAYIKSCHSCAYSDYPTCGYGLFGMMLCFRNHKQRYLEVQRTPEYKNIWTMFELQVQETYLCPEYQPRALDKLH